MDTGYTVEIVDGKAVFTSPLEQGFIPTEDKE